MATGVMALMMLLTVADVSLRYFLNAPITGTTEICKLMMVIVIEMGLVTPPVGMDAFVLSGVTGIPISTIFRGVLPFLIPMIVCIVILAAFPQIALFLPGTM